MIEMPSKRSMATFYVIWVMRYDAGFKMKLLYIFNTSHSYI